MALHAATGQALETLYADRLEDIYDRLACHYSKTDKADKAVKYLTHFAEKVARKHAHVEAVTALQEALVHVERLPTGKRDRCFLDVMLRQAYSLHFLGRSQDSLGLLLRQRERLERLGDPSIASPYYFWLGHIYNYLGDHRRAAQSAHRAIEEAERCGDQATMGKAYHVLALEDYWSCQFLQGVEHGRRAVFLLERTEERWWLGHSHWVTAMNYILLGELRPSLEAAAQTQAIGDAIGDRQLQTDAAWITGVIHI
jgi:hypothetical protein